MKTLESQHDTEVLKRSGLQDENNQLMDQVAKLSTNERQLNKVNISNPMKTLSTGFTSKISLSRCRLSLFSRI